MARASTTSFGRRVWRVRISAYVAFACLAAALALEAEPCWPFLALACALVVAPFAVRALDERYRARTRWLENVATPFLLMLASVPTLPAAAACSALLAGTLAQRGYRALPMALATIGVGAVAGHSLAFEVRFDATLLAAVSSFVFLVAFCTPLAAWGYEEAVREQRARRELDARSLALERHRDALIRYLPDDLPRRLDAGATAPMRRWLTVAAVDLEAFTALLERLAPEDVVTVLDDVYGALARLARDRGGVLHKFLGDGALVCFGADEARGRRIEAGECVRFVDALSAELFALNRSWLRAGVAAQLSARAGIASGFCTLGALGRDDRLDFTLIGLPVNLASRLQMQAPRDGALVDVATAALLDDDVRARLGEAVEMAIKGFAAPVAVRPLLPVEEGSQHHALDA